MKSFRLLSNWNGDGVRLFNFRRFLEMRDFDLRKGNIRIIIHDDGNWDFFNPPKEESKVEEQESKTETQYVPTNEIMAMGVEVEKPAEMATEPDEPKPKPPKRLPCPKCGMKHWPSQKCRREEN